jgi:hypothetical protein
LDSRQMRVIPHEKGWRVKRSWRERNILTERLASAH